MAPRLKLGAKRPAGALFDRPHAVSMLTALCPLEGAAATAIDATVSDQPDAPARLLLGDRCQLGVVSAEGRWLRQLGRLPADARTVLP